MCSIGGLARHFGASEGTVGLLTAGGEWEELVVVLAAVLSGKPGLALGNIVGACLANLIGSLPLGMLVHHEDVPIPIPAPQQADGVMHMPVIHRCKPLHRPSVVEVLKDMGLPPQHREILSGRDVP